MGFFDAIHTHAKLTQPPNPAFPSFQTRSQREQQGHQPDLPQTHTTHPRRTTPWGRPPPRTGKTETEHSRGERALLCIPLTSPVVHYGTTWYLCPRCSDSEAPSPCGAYQIAALSGEIFICFV